MKEPNPKKGRKPAIVKVQERDGSWRELKRDEPMSSDPEINALWDLPVADLEKILDDPAHPKYEKALAVSAQAFAPLQAAVQELLKSATFDSVNEATKPLVGPLGSLAEGLRPVLPKMDKSWISEMVREYPAWQMLRRSLPAPVDVGAVVVDSIDFDSPTPPDAPLRVVASAADDLALEMLREIATTAREQLDQVKSDAVSNAEALSIARESLKVAKESLTVSQESRDAARGGRTAGWWAAGAALLAAVVGFFGIIVAVAIATR